MKMIILWAIALLLVIGCTDRTADLKEMEVVDRQQEHYARVQPVPFYEYSIPRDVLVQIYNVITQEARLTYSVIETITGTTKYRSPSIGFAIPADVSLTNPEKPTRRRHGNEYSVTIGQAEPNGLFASRNTDGTWVLCVWEDGTIYPFYTEHKVSTWPFAVKKNDEGEWARADKRKINFQLKIDKAQAEIKKALHKAQ